MTGFTLQSTAGELEARIRGNRLLSPTAFWAGELVYPYYDGLSLYNVPRTVANLLGVPGFESGTLDDAVWGGRSPAGQVDRVVVFLSDGLSYLWLRQLMAEEESIREAVKGITDGRGPVPLTSISPSTTVAALTTLWTGASPAEHGIVGLLLMLRDIATLGLTLFFKPAYGDLPFGSLQGWGVDPAGFVPVPGLAERLAEAGVPTHILLEKRFVGSGISQFLHRGVEHKHTHIGYGDFWRQLDQLMQHTRGQRCYISVYWPAVDSLAHEYGATSLDTRREIHTQLNTLRNILGHPDIRDGRTLVLFLADHGHFDTAHVLPTDGKRFAPVREALRLKPGGEPRLNYLYLRSGYKQAAIDALEEHYADSLAWFDTADALAAGLFGPGEVNAEVPFRLGDLIAAPRRNHRLASDVFPDMVGWHGGLDGWEMLIPLLWARL